MTACDQAGILVWQDLPFAWPAMGPLRPIGPNPLPAIERAYCVCSISAVGIMMCS